MSSRKTEAGKNFLFRSISIGLLFLVWWAAAFIAADPQTLPDPFSVFRLIADEAASGELFSHLFATLFRVLCAFVLAMAIGTAIGLFLGMRQKLNTWFDSWVVILLNIPALVTIVLCYLWIGLTEVAAVAAVAINKIPMVIVIVREGARAFDPRLNDLAKVYRLSASDHFRHVLLPQLVPHLAAAARTGIALIWKIVLVVEFLGRPNGIGFQIHLGFQLFDIAMVLAYAVAFVIVMLLIEILILQPMEDRANRWRHD